MFGMKLFSTVQHINSGTKHPDFAEHPVWPKHVVGNKKQTHGVYM
jgi:hypothetical protein